MKYCKILPMLLFYCLFAIECFSQTVAVGSGSYTTQLPPPDAAGRNVDPTGTPRVSGPAASKPIVSSDWWTGLLTFDNANLYNYPMSFRALTNGLVVSYTTPGNGVDDTRQPMSGDQPLLVGVNGLSVTNPTVYDYSDWTVTAGWAGGGHTFNATIGMGMPFVYCTKGSSDVASVKVTIGTVSVQNEMILVTNSLGGSNFAVYAPVGSTWTQNGNTYTSTLAGKNYFSVAMLPSGVAASTAASDFKQYAYVFPANTSVTWSYDNATSTARSTFTVTPDKKEGSGTNVLLGLLPHQWAHLGSGSAQPGSYSYPTVRGTLKMVASNTFIVENKFKGVLPTLPNTAKNSSGFDPGALATKIDQVKGDGLQLWTDSYNDGLAMNRLIQVAKIADQNGNTAARDQIIATVKERLENWFKAESGENAFLFYYNSTWSTLIGYPAGYYSDANLNDHHFHYGYFISAAAAVEQFQPGWASQWGGMVNLLIKDAANWDKADSNFPFLRNFNPYAGHSFATGLLNNEPHGNNQESSSEAMNFNASLIHWGTLTGNTAIRDLGIFLYTTEQTAIDEYWFNVNNRNFSSTYGHPMASRVWGDGYDRGTFWTNDIAAMYGIEMVPMTASSFYLGQNTAYVSKLWNDMKANTGVLQNVPNDNLWYDVYWQYLSLIDPAQAISLYNGYQNRAIKNGESDAHTYNWLHAFNGAGQIDGSITANYPIAAVFNKAGNKTYVAHNYGSSSITVSFSDGFSMTVPARTMKTSKDIDAKATLTSSSSQIPANGSVTLTATVSGTVSKVEFYNGTTLIGTKTGAPYTVTTSALPAGKPNFYVRVYNGTNFNLSNVVRVLVGSQIPYGGTAWAIPGTIEAGNYDGFEGGVGQEVSYFDTDVANQAGSFRSPEYVDAGGTTGEGNTVGWINNGEWMEYTVNVTQGGTYDVTLRYTSGNNGGGGPFWFEREDGTKISSDITVAMNDVNWTAYVDKVVTGVSLAAGRQVIRVKVGNGGFNLGKMTFVYKGGGDTQAPTAPTNLASPSKTTSSVNLTWTASTDNVGVTGYEVYVGSESTPRATVTTTSATIGSLAAGTTYSFKVRAKDAANNFSAYSGSISVTTNTDSDTQAPTAPTNLASPSKTTSSVNLTWTASTDNVGVTGYEVYVGSESTPRTTVTTNSATIGSLSASTTYSFKVRAKDAANNFSAYSGSISVTTNGTGAAIPGTIEAENYSAMNGIQLETTTDTNGGQNVGWIDAGDWMDYAVNVAAAGSYTVTYRVASQSGGGSIQLRSGSTTLATTSVPSTGNWQAWTNVTATANLTAGSQTLRLYAAAGGFNVNWIQFVSSSDTQAPTAPTNLASPSKTTSSVNLTWTASTDNVGVTGYEVYVGSESTPRATVTTNSATIGSLSASTTYSFKVRAKDAANNFSAYSSSISVTTNGTGAAIPGTIEAENYSAMNGIQLETTTDTNGGQNVGWIDAGDWMDYAVNVAAAGSYTVTYRVASQSGGGSIQLRSGSTTLATTSVPSTGNWQAWTNVTATANLTAGSQTLRLYAAAGGFNINWIQFATSCSPTAITPYLSVNGGAWTQTSSATLAVGGSVTVGPQPTSGGSWSWTGPNGFTSTAREFTLSNIQSNQGGNYIATYTNSCGATSTQTFAITVTTPVTGATVYQDCSYGGTAVTLAEGTYTTTQLSALGVSNNWVSSVKVPSGYSVVFYDGDNFTGSSYTATADNSCLVGNSFNDLTSSLKVVKTTGGVCTGTASNGDYTYEVSTSGGNVNWTFIPGSPIAGSTMAIIYVKVGSGGYAGYNMTASGSNFTYTGAFASGQVLTFYFTYRVGNTGTERNSSANPHTYTVGTTCSGARFAEMESSGQENNAIIYPNPVENTLYFTDAIEGAQVIIRNLNGSKVFESKVSNQSIDLSSLQKGVYFIFINDGSTVKTKQFIKR